MTAQVCVYGLGEDVPTAVNVPNESFANLEALKASLHCPSEGTLLQVSADFEEWENVCNVPIMQTIGRPLYYTWKTFSAPGSLQTFKEAGFALYYPAQLADARARYAQMIGRPQHEVAALINEAQQKNRDGYDHGLQVLTLLQLQANMISRIRF